MPSGHGFTSWEIYFFILWTKVDGSYCYSLSPLKEQVVLQGSMVRERLTHFGKYILNE